MSSVANRVRVALWLIVRWLLSTAIVALILFCGGGLVYKYCIGPSYEVWKPFLCWALGFAVSGIGVWIVGVSGIILVCWFVLWFISILKDKDNSCEKESTTKIIADLPIKKRTDDLFSRGAYVQALASLIMSKPSDEGARYVGVYAPWGEGKTSVRNLLEERIVADYGASRAVFVDFSPWEYPEKFDVGTAFFERLAQAVSGICNAGMASLFSQVSRMMTLRRVDQTVGAIQEIVDFCRRIWFRFVMPEDALLQALYGLLKNSNKHIVVVIDDLERLPKDEVCRVVRFLKAHGDIPCLTYLVLADEDHLAAAVSGMLCDSEKPTFEQGREYLEKIVPIRCPLPAINGNVLLNVFRQKIDELLKSYKLPLAASIENWELTLPYLQNARKMKILLNAYSIQLATFKRKVAGHQYMNVHLGDLLMLTVMKVFEPKFYELLFNGYWEVYRGMSLFEKDSGVTEADYQRIFFQKVKDAQTVHRFLQDVVGIVRTGTQNEKYRLGNPQSTDLLRDYRLASLYCIGNYFLSETEDIQLSQDEVESFLSCVRNGDIPIDLIYKLNDEKRLPYLLYALENQPLFDMRQGSDCYMRTLIHLSTMQLNNVILPEAYEPTAFFGRTGIYPRIFRCLLFYCVKIKQGIMSGNVYYGERIPHVSKVLFSILRDVEDDVYVLSEFIAHDDKRHCGFEVDYDALFDKNDYERLKELYLDRIEQFQGAGKLVPHPEFFDLFRTWTILLEHQGSDGRRQRFRSVCLSMLGDSIAVTKMLVFFVQDNRSSGSVSDQLEVWICIDRFQKFFGLDKLQDLLATLESLQSLDLYAFHALISLRYVVDGIRNNRTLDVEQQKEHLLKYIATDDYVRERREKVRDES